MRSVIAKLDTTAQLDLSSASPTGLELNRLSLSGTLCGRKLGDIIHYLVQKKDRCIDGKQTNSHHKSKQRKTDALMENILTSHIKTSVN